MAEAMQPTAKLYSDLIERMERLRAIARNQQMLSMTTGDEIRVVTEIRVELEAMLGYASQLRTQVSRVKAAFQKGARMIEQKERELTSELLGRLEQEGTRLVREAEEAIAWLTRRQGGAGP